MPNLAETESELIMNFDSEPDSKEHKNEEDVDHDDTPSKRKKDLYSWDEKFVWNFYLI